MAKVTWNQDEYDESAPRNFEPLPKGLYPCVIAKSDEKQTKAGTGSYFEFEFEVVKGEHKGRKLWARLNINNPSEMAQKIGREQFKALCASAGKPGAKTTEALHGKFVACYVSIEQGTNGPLNRVDGFATPEAYREGSAPETAPKTKPAAPPAGPAKNEPKEEIDDDIPFIRNSCMFEEVSARERRLRRYR